MSMQQLQQQQLLQQQHAAAARQMQMNGGAVYGGQGSPSPRPGTPGVVRFCARHMRAAASLADLVRHMTAKHTLRPMANTAPHLRAANDPSS